VENLHPEVMLNANANLKSFLGLIGLQLFFKLIVRQCCLTFFFPSGRLIFFYTIHDKKKYLDRDVHGDRTARSSILHWLNLRIKVAGLHANETGGSPIAPFIRPSTFCNYFYY